MDGVMLVRRWSTNIACICFSSRRRRTRWPRDWSSDVCSSDLPGGAKLPHMLDALEALRASLAPHYDIERQIGAGGMARVFLAVEQHPHRRVAIKVLDPEVSTRLLRERFIREVDLSSNLSHPHIVPIFSAGEVDGLFYYVMPYVEGESLRHRLLRERNLPLETALHIAR